MFSSVKLHTFLFRDKILKPIVNFAFRLFRFYKLNHKVLENTFLFLLLTIIFYKSLRPTHFCIHKSQSTGKEMHSIHEILHQCTSNSDSQICSLSLPTYLELAGLVCSVCSALKLSWFIHFPSCSPFMFTTKLFKLDISLY